MNSCTKREITENPATLKKDVTNNEEMVLNKIIAFREKITLIQDNPTYKSGEFTTTDSAVWYLDATLNLSHAFISWETLGDFYHDSIFVTIPKNNGFIGYNDLATAYSELKQKVADVCIAAPGSDKELYIASLTKKEEDANSLTIKAGTTIGSIKLPADWHPFEKGWMYGDTLGDCSYPPQFIGQDACKQLRDKTNDFRYLYIDDEQMVYITIANEEPYVTLRSENQIFINTADPIPGDNHYERLLVYQEQNANYHDCIEEDEMNWYYQKLHYVIYNMVPNNEEVWPNVYGKTFIEVKVDNNSVSGTYGTKDNEQGIIRHQYKVEYRIGVYVGDKTAPESIVEN